MKFYENKFQFCVIHLILKFKKIIDTIYDWFYTYTKITNKYNIILPLYIWKKNYLLIVKALAPKCSTSTLAVWKILSNIILYK